MKKEHPAAIGNMSSPGFIETSDIGEVAAEAGRWKIHLGSIVGSRQRNGDVLCTVAAREEALKYMARFIQFYTENRKSLERPYDFVKRLGIERVRKVLVEDSNGICARLDAAVERASRSYPALWQGPENPIQPSHFVEVLEPLAAEAGPFERKCQPA